MQTSVIDTGSVSSVFIHTMNEHTFHLLFQNVKINIFRPANVFFLKRCHYNFLSEIFTCIYACYKLFLLIVEYNFPMLTV